MAVWVGALAFVLLPAAAVAAPPVTTTTDGGAGSLREAVTMATPGETIAIPAGNYKLTLGELTIAKSLTLVGAGAGVTVLEGGGASRVGVGRHDRRTPGRRVPARAQRR